MGRAYGTHGEEEGCLQGFGEDPEGKRPFGRSRHRWEDNMKIDLKEVGFGVWTESRWLRRGTDGRHL